MESNSNIEVDNGHLFETNTIFGCSEELIEWVRLKAIENRMVIVVKRSNANENSRKPRVSLACEQNGTHREFKRKVSRFEEMSLENGEQKEIKQKERKRTGTKKCGCKFLLRGQWTLKVVHGTHNHELAEFLEGHSFSGRLTLTQEPFVQDLSKTNIKPLGILAALKDKWPNTKSTLRTIYNFRTKHRVVERRGRSQLQYLMGKLQDHGYFFHHRRCEKTDVVKDIFWAHPTSVELLCAFPSVVLMDCTYKANRYKLSLLEIVGVTSTSLTFNIEFAYLESEREDNYLWACTILKTLMEE